MNLWKIKTGDVYLIEHHLGDTYTLIYGGKMDGIKAMIEKLDKMQEKIDKQQEGINAARKAIKSMKKRRNDQPVKPYRDAMNPNLYPLVDIL